MIQEREQVSPSLNQNKVFIQKVNSYVMDLSNNLPGD